MLDKPESSNPEAFERSALEALALRFEALAEECGAEKFHLFHIRGRSHALVAVPGLASPEAAQHTLSLPEDFGKQAATSMCVLWWDEADGALAKNLGDSEWAIRIHPGQPRTGLAMPIDGGDAGRGVAVFTGARLDIGEEAMMEVHARCHLLFNELPEITPEREESSLPPMSRRELQCLKLTACGLTSDDIARKLGLSVHTANQYLANAAQKLNATNRIHAVAKALREGLIE